MDTVAGTSGNDTIKGVLDATATTGMTTFNTGDAINGGAGKDTLSLTVSGTTANNIVDLNSVEVVNIRALNTVGGAHVQNTATWTGVEQIWSDRSGETNSLTLQNVGSANTTFGLNSITGTGTAAVAETQTVGVTARASGTATTALTFLGATVANATVADTAANVVTKVVADKANIIATWNAANPTKELADITGSSTTITLVYKTSEGNVAAEADITAGADIVGFDFTDNVTLGVAGANGTGAQITIGTTAAAVAGSADTLKIAAIDAGGTVLQAASERDAAVTSFANVAANAGFEAVSIDASGTKTSYVDLAQAGSTLATITATGSQALVLGGVTSGTVLKTINSTNTAGLTLNASGSTTAITATLAAGTNTLTTGTGNDVITATAGNNTINAGTGNDSVTTGAGNDTITVGAGSVKVNAGDGNNVVIVAGLDKTDSLKAGAGTADVLGLSAADAVLASAATTDGADLRATYSGFERLRVDSFTTGTIDAGKLGFNYIQLSDTGAAGTLSNVTDGATIEVLGRTDFTSALTVNMKDAATNSNDTLNLVLNADLLQSDNNVTTTFAISGINNVKVTANDRVNFAGDDTQTAAGMKDNGADDGYTLGLTTSPNLNSVVIDGSSKINYTVDSSSTALKTINASASTGDLVINATAFVGTERLTITGSQGTNTLTGSNTTFGDALVGGAKADVFTGLAGADAITSGGGRDAFVLNAASDSGVTASTMDTITGFGKVTEAVLAADVTAMSSVAAFQSSTTGKGGADAGLLKLAANATLGGAQAATDMITALEAVDTTVSEFAGKTITATESAKGMLTLGGADAAMVDTLAEWVAVANAMAASNGDVVGFQFNGNTYVFQQGTTDSAVQLTGVTGVTGITLVGGTVAAAIGDIFVG